MSDDPLNPVHVLADWNLETLHFNSSGDDVLAALTAKVQELLTNNPKYFFQALYRLDIDEEKVSWVLKKEEKSRQPAKFAELILKRELQKAKSRADYEKQAAGSVTLDQDQRRLQKKD